MIRRMATRLVVVLLPVAMLAQARPFPDTNVQVIYQRLLPQIEKIRIFDNHAHPGYPDDSDVDAMVAPPGASALRLRDDNPELAIAAKHLFGYPYADLSPEHAKWLVAKKGELKKKYGDEYFAHILDQVGIETSAANRVAMPGYLDPHRFRWVFFVDNFLFPFDNRRMEEKNADLALYMPLQRKLLERNLKLAGLAQLPPDLDAFVTFVDKVVSLNRAEGAIAMKFEAAYFRSLHFEDPPKERVAEIYARYYRGGVPADAEYTAFQDYVFRRLLEAAERNHLSVHFHTAVGIGDYFSMQKGNVMNLENVLRDPRYRKVDFVLLHGGYPLERRAIWLAAPKNVYLDSSLMELYMYPAQFKNSLREWLELFPDKVMFGSDAFPFNQALGAEEAYWLAVHSARTALAAALAEMVADDEITEIRALQMAHGYLHDNAARLYESLTTESQY